MNLTQALRSFFVDDRLVALLVVILLDLVLGIVAAVRLRTFAFSRVSAFLRDDVLAKLVPWAALYIGSKLAPSVDLGGVTLDVAQNTVYALILVAFGGSVLSSLRDMGLLASTSPRALTAGEHSEPVPVPPPRGAGR